MVSDTQYFPMSMMLVRVPRGWEGVAIELNVTVSEETPATAMEHLVDAVGQVLCADLAHGRPPRLRPPAAEHLYDLFHEVMRGGSAESPERFDQMAIPALFVLERQAGVWKWHEIQGLPMGGQIAPSLGGRRPHRALSTA